MVHDPPHLWALLLEACHQGCVTFRSRSFVSWLKLGSRCKARLANARSPGFQLPRCWLTCIALAGARTELALQTPRERAQPLGVEILLALRQLRGVTLPGVSPLAEDADVVRSLRFYFLTAHRLQRHKCNI